MEIFPLVERVDFQERASLIIYLSIRLFCLCGFTVTSFFSLFCFILNFSLIAFLCLSWTIHLNTLNVWYLLKSIVVYMIIHGIITCLIDNVYSFNLPIVHSTFDHECRPDWDIYILQCIRNLLVFSIPFVYRDNFKSWCILLSLNNLYDPEHKLK